jgi:hypothetical protein
MQDLIINHDDGSVFINKGQEPLWDDDVLLLVFNSHYYKSNFQKPPVPDLFLLFRGVSVIAVYKGLERSPLLPGWRKLFHACAPTYKQTCAAHAHGHVTRVTSCDM